MYALKLKKSHDKFSMIILFFLWISREKKTKPILFLLFFFPDMLRVSTYTYIFCVSTVIFRYQKCKLNGFGRQRSFIYVSRETRDCTTKQFFFICICISICSVQFIYFMLFFSFYYYCYDYNNYCYFNFMLLVAFVKKTMIKSRRKITTPCMKSLCVHMWGEHSEHTWIYIYT